MGNKNIPTISQDDMDLFLRIGKHGYVDIDYVYMFAYKGRKKRTIYDRIMQLSKHGYLCITKTFIPPDYNVNYRVGYMIIALGINGIKYLDFSDVVVVNNTKAIQNASPYRMYHQVQVATVCDILFEKYESQDQESNWEVQEIFNEREAYLEDALNQPDAILLFRQKSRDKQDAKAPMIAVFLEIERSYASKQSLLRKLKGYKISITKKLYKNHLKYNIIENRILFVAQTQGQKKALENKVITCEYGKQLDILIAGYADVTNTPLGAVYMSPKDLDSKNKLLGKLH